MSKESPLSATGKLWHLKAPDERTVLGLAQQYNLPEIVTRLLVNRGVTLETADNYLRPTLRELLPDPSLLLDMDKAIERTIKAIEAKQPIVVYGDYDVDGATSSALLRRYFKDIGYPIQLYIPDRIEEGYGANKEALELLYRQGQRLVLMVDSGTTAFEPLEHAHSLGLDVIILDHHTAQPALPKTIGIVNPNRLDQDLGNYGYLRHLCAAGVSFLFLIALQRTLREKGWFKDKSEPDLLQYLDLVALGTVCDVMPLVGLNRAFVTQGLKVLKGRQNLGLSILSDISGVNEAISTYHLGFILGPRINAGGRVGQANLGSLLLTTDDKMEAQKIANSLNQFNLQRQEIEKQVLEEATGQIEARSLHNHPVLLVGEEGWHPGVIGIVASRLKERYNRPACVVGFENGIGKGSGRSITGVELGAAMHIAVHQSLLEKGGGHAMAAGFTVHRDKYDLFHTFLNNHLGKQISEITPTLKLDGYLSISAATEDLLETIGCLEPFGSGNASPKFAFNQVRVAYIDTVGENHLRCQLADEAGNRLKAMAFRAKDTPLGMYLEETKGERIQVAGTLKLDSWQGSKNVSFTIEDAMAV
ncbi:MAG: single-stranded-DNA-specific exonuclease RecJ [Alphaproteobacteria bacterium]|nr:single-stranded-DNA-specific exonuclease RecJ [Alphaproteobacteria bacterium]